MRSGLLVLACLVPGCVFDGAGIAPRDLTAGPGDSAALDSTGRAERAPDLAPPDDGPVDAAAIDRPPPDQPIPDQPPVDLAPAPDLAPPPDHWSPTQACTKKYGSAASFILCASSATSCTFHVMTNENTCQNECTKHGGSCLGGRDDAGGCTPSSQTSSCLWVHNTQICTCSLP